MKDIVISVGLPIFNGKDIAWLALEGLCRQQCNNPWELIICEEQNLNMVGIEQIKLVYKDRLRVAGCVRVTYIPIKNWIFLSRKWKIICSFIDDRSKYFLPWGADNFCQSIIVPNSHEG